MGIFDIFSSRSYEKLENKGNRYFEANHFGDAKLAYENALSRLEGKIEPGFVDFKKRIEDKIEKSREALAFQHKASAEDLIEAGCDEDAAELLELAMELTGQPELTLEIENLLRNIRARAINPATKPVVEVDPGFAMGDDIGDNDSDDQYFMALCGALPEDEQHAYLSYGSSFRKGYVALNQGEFDRAVDLLSQATDEHGADAGYIHLELAGAYLNLGDMETAYALLKRVIENYPGAIRAYELFCDILWERGEHTEALERLRSCPDDLKTSLPINLLLGETLFQSGKQKEAEAFYLEQMDLNGWDEYMARGLAKTYESLGLKEKAREIYARIMTGCKGCGGSVSPLVKQRYAELSYEAGDASEAIVEIYLSLCQDDPYNRKQYYHRLSDIYSKNGHHNEAKRYQGFAEMADAPDDAG